MMSGMGGNGFGMGGGGSMMFLFWIVILVALFFGIRWIMSNSANKRNDIDGNDALRILENRYAKGEIDRQEFEEKKQDLLGH